MLFPFIVISKLFASVIAIYTVSFLLKPSFSYIVGLIKAIQLDYSEAHKNLMNAIRKAPQNVAIGFKQHVSLPSLHHFS